MEENNNSWINIADIMSALMMVFMFISIVFMYQLQNQKEIYRIELNKALNKEFEQDLKKWNASITKNNIIRFSSPFKIGDSAISLDFKNKLDDFFPRYIKLLSTIEFKNEIAEIRVEGHTSNGWNTSSSEKEIYLKNMKLSQERASNVLSYTYNIENKNINKNRKWLEKYLRANGMAFSNCLYEDNNKTKTDASRSRRVDFRVIAKEHF